MTSACKGRRPVFLAFALMAAVIAGAASPVEAARKKPPPPAPAPPPVPGVSLSPSVIQMASAYRAYLAQASAIPPAFADGESVAAGVRAGAAYEPKHLLRGAIAYGAVVALQDPGFVAGVRRYVVDPTQRREIAYAVMRDPAYAVGFEGSAGAAGLVIAALGEDGQRLLAHGRKVKQAAYDVQRSPWSKAHVARPGERLAAAKQLSATPAPGDLAETQRLSLAVGGGAPLALTAQSRPPPYTQTVIRSLAVAALAALGYADDASLAQVTPMLAEPNSASCLNMAKLNLYQCLAVSRPHYEDVFCLGQHELMDTGMCVMTSIGLPVPDDLKPKMATARGEPFVKAKVVTKRRPVKKKR